MAMSRGMILASVIALIMTCSLATTGNGAKDENGHEFPCGRKHPERCSLQNNGDDRARKLLFDSLPEDAMFQSDDIVMGH
ncbi:hypothetical protein Acr_12g0001290 [Actinidia rufa]|uniref:Uncharacterized protein n=1 Tax=Actinidia rufa TaxID=165716 RepID=A0A7J0FFX5_9ERIC|nr:hypothetical protein Acr_12g0001290 [Actinidia rufa]